MIYVVTLQEAEVQILSAQEFIEEIENALKIK